MCAQLIIEEGPFSHLSLNLDEGKQWVVGKDEDTCQLVLDDPLIENEHVILTKTASGIELNSLVGNDSSIFVNQQEISEFPYILKANDTLRIGETTLRFVAEDSRSNALVENQEDETDLDSDTIFDETLSEQSDSPSVLEDLSSESEKTLPEEERENFLVSEEVENANASDSVLEGSPTEQEFAHELENSTDPAAERLATSQDAPYVDDDLDNDTNADSLLEDLPLEPNVDEDHLSDFKEENLLDEEFVKDSTDRQSENQNDENPSLSVSPSTLTEEEINSLQKNYDTIFADDGDDIGALAEIDFGISEAGRWLLKVIGGPNNGAEFYMQTDQAYIIGTDPQNCDIVFNDTSVSRQHAKISFSSEEKIIIEDLRSRNKVFVDGVAIEDTTELNPNTIVTLGTTSFVIYDREGEMQTIISPLLPSLVKALQKENEPKEDIAADPLIVDYTANYVPQTEEQIAAANEQAQPLAPPLLEELPKPEVKNIGPMIFFICILSFFLLAGLGTYALFRAQPVEMVQQENAVEMIKQVLSPYPAVRFSYNKFNSSLVLMGHVSTLADKTQLLSHLQALKFVKSMDDGIVIDDYAWQEFNSILANTPAWRGISINSPAAGEFILTGYLKTRKQAEDLSSYVSLNFPYVDLLKKQVVVEEDVVNRVNSWLQNDGLSNITAKMTEGTLSLTGLTTPDKLKAVSDIVEKAQKIPGIRQVSNYVKTTSPELGRIDISNNYSVSGTSRIGDKMTVVINGRILSEGDFLDGMDIVKINPNNILLEKGEKKYRIDY